MKKNDGNSMDASYRLGLISSQAFSVVNFRGPLVRALVNRGVTVYAFAPDYDRDSRAAVLALGAVPVDYSMSRAGMNPLKDVVDLFRLTMKLRSLDLHAVFSYFIKPVIYGTLAARLAGVAKRFAMIEGAGYVFTESRENLWRRRLLRGFVTQLYRLGLSQADAVFMLNPDDKKMFVEDRMVSASKVQLLPGIGLELSDYVMVELVVQPVCFLLIGRLLLEKGIYDYIDAARQVKRLHPEVRFILLGGVDLNPSSISESEVRAWVDEGLVEWPGHVADVREWIAESSVFVLPSYREGLPRSTQEVMAMGRPVITTDVPGCRETVQEGVNGFMVPVRDSASLAAAMLSFVRAPELIAPMGAQSRRIAEENFNVHKINAIILAAMGFGRAKSHV